MIIFDFRKGKRQNFHLVSVAPKSNFLLSRPLPVLLWPLTGAGFRTRGLLWINIIEKLAEQSRKIALLASLPKGRVGPVTS
jgi:hypothetical protein